MYKLEYKYLVPVEQLESIRNAMMPYLDYDPFARKNPGKEYTVRSIYLDTDDFLCYHEKVEGIKKRHKYRVRGYNHYDNNAPVFIEIKRKNNSYIYKNRAKVTSEDLPSIFNLNTSETEHEDMNCFDGTSSYNLEKFLYYYNTLNLSPVILILYEREAFESKFDSRLRITYDKNLRSALARSIDELFAGEDFVSSLDGYFILEIKFQDSFPHWLSSIINRYGLRRQSVSKYAISIRSHINELQYFSRSAV
jgi:hypothetical protein